MHVVLVVVTFVRIVHMSGFVTVMLVTVTLVRIVWVHLEDPFGLACSIVGRPTS